MRKVDVQLILLALLSFSVITYAEEGVIAPPAKGKYATVYQQPGFNWKNCDQYKVQCVPINWLRIGTKIEIKRAVSVGEVPRKGKNEVLYYEVEYLNDGEKETGYIEASYVNTQFCGKPSSTHFSKIIQNLEQIQNRFQIESAPLRTVVRQKEVQKEDDEFLPLLSDFRVFNSRCQNFIDPDGQLGKWGQDLTRAFERVNKKCFYEDIKIDNVCPGFKKFGQEMKQKFWAYVFASIAQVESSCNQNARAPGVNGVADGLFQLEADPKLRKRSDRNAVHCNTARPTNTQAIRFQFDCAASIINDFHCGPGRQLSSAEGYWERLRGANNTISRLIRKFQGCAK